jgi:hypothetical protein
MAPLMPQCDRGCCARLPSATLPGVERCDPARSVAYNLCASAARSLLKEYDRRGSGRQGRAAGLRQPAVRALRRHGLRETLPRAIPERRAIALRPEKRPRLPFQANLLCFRAFLGSLAREGRRDGLRKQKIGKWRQVAAPDPS